MKLFFVLTLTGLFASGLAHACECVPDLLSADPDDIVFKVAKEHLVQLGYKFTETGPSEDLENADDRSKNKLLIAPIKFYRSRDDRLYARAPISGGNCVYSGPQGELMYACSRQFKADFIVPYGLCSMKIRVFIDHVSSSGHVVSSSCDKVEQSLRVNGQ